MRKYAEIKAAHSTSNDAKHSNIHLFQLENHAKYICKICEYPGPSGSNLSSIWLIIKSCSVFISLKLFFQFLYHFTGYQAVRFVQTACVIDPTHSIFQKIIFRSRAFNFQFRAINFKTLPEKCNLSSLELINKYLIETFRNSIVPCHNFS